MATRKRHLPAKSMANVVRQDWRGAVSKHCPAEPVQGRTLKQSNINQNVLPVANAPEPRIPGTRFHPSDPVDSFGFDKLVFFC